MSSSDTPPPDKPQRLQEYTNSPAMTGNEGLNTQVEAQDHIDAEQIANAKSELDLPTDSHALVHEELEEKGLIHKVSKADDETFAGAADVGWTQEPHEFEEQIVGGVKNDDLWTFIRRFNKQIYHVKATNIRPLDNLDFNIAEEGDKFSPDRLRAEIERLYITVIVGVISAWKHIARLRSWREPRRTTAFCAVYFTAWIFDLIVPTILTALVVLIVYPPARQVLFPPAPIALVNSKTGGIQKPKAGVLGSHNTITGAPEKHSGEAVEQEASNLVTSITSVALGTVARQSHSDAADDSGIEPSVPDPTDIATATADVQTAAHGGVPTKKHDKTKKPMKDAVESKIKPLMTVLQDASDTYERFSNALSPTPPFPPNKARLRLAAVVAPGILVSALTSAEMLVKTTSFIFGAVFFADPLLWRAAHYLNHKFPHWQKLLELRNSILKGVPTNAQVTITLLRFGEANGAPIPPPPSSLEPVPARSASINDEALALDASPEEIEHAAKPDPAIVKQNTEQKPPEKKRKGFGALIVSFFRGTTATSVEAKLATNRPLAAIGSQAAKNHLGILPKKGQPINPRGPSEFQARFKGRKGAAVIDLGVKPPILYFTTDPGNELPEQKETNVMFSIPIQDIQEVRKVGAMGWKGKIVVGWAETQKEVVDGIEVIGKDKGQSYYLTAMKTRDELFNRLVSIGSQIWDML